MKPKWLTKEEVRERFPDKPIPKHACTYCDADTDNPYNEEYKVYVCDKCTELKRKPPKHPNYYFQACKRAIKLERDFLKLLDECEVNEIGEVNDLCNIAQELSKRIRTLRKTPGSHSYNRVMTHET